MNCIAGSYACPMSPGGLYISGLVIGFFAGALGALVFALRRFASLKDEVDKKTLAYKMLRHQYRMLEDLICQPHKDIDK